VASVGRGGSAMLVHARLRALSPSFASFGNPDAPQRLSRPPGRRLRAAVSHRGFPAFPDPYFDVAVTGVLRSSAESGPKVALTVAALSVQ